MADETTAGAGYHLRQIKRGVFGEMSKIREELEEAEDALEQDAAIMLLVELSDMVGSIKGFLAKHFPDITLADLEVQADITGRAFQNGHRKAR